MRYILWIIVLNMTLSLSLEAQSEVLGLSFTERRLNVAEQTHTNELNVKPIASVDKEPFVSSPLEVVSLSKPSVWKPNSTYALLWSILPGGGQIYNRKYWKVPIVWGALMTSFYTINWNQRLYSEYHAAYRDLKSEDPSQNTAWLAFAPRGTKPEDYAQMDRLTSTLRRGNDYYRRYRDVSIVVGILLYGLSMLDAYVDAELYTFDISPDLSMKVSPTILSPMPSMYLPDSNPYQVGLACSFTF